MTAFLISFLILWINRSVPLTLLSPSILDFLLSLNVKLPDWRGRGQQDELMWTDRGPFCFCLLTAAFTNWLLLGFAPAFFSFFKCPPPQPPFFPPSIFLIYYFSFTFTLQKPLFDYFIEKNLRYPQCLHFPNLTLSQECSSNKTAVNEPKRSLQWAPKQQP